MDLDGFIKLLVDHVVGSQVGDNPPFQLVIGRKSHFSLLSNAKMGPS